jgi:transketolase
VSMRKAFVNTVEGLLDADPRLALLLCDIGVFGFRGGFARHPARVLNIGILEQATIGMAAGLATTGMVPVVHSIAPFLVERALEQLKIDFSYQRLGGNFVSVGASYDYAALGCTHHCPGDVGVLKTLPGFEIVLPGTAAEFDSLFRQGYANGNPTYFRLSERENPDTFEVALGEARVVRQGTRATVLALGPALGPVLEGCRDLDVTILYYTCAAPFDAKTLAANCPSGKLALYEPCFSGALAADALKALFPRPVTVDLAGQPGEFLQAYGRAPEHDSALGMTPQEVHARVSRLIHA